MANGLPYFKWYPADAETDTDYAAMTNDEVGFYHRCLNRAWINGGLPADHEDLARTMKVTKAYLAKVWKRVGRKFEPSESDASVLVNPRQEKERTHAVSKRGKCSSAVRTRYARTTGVGTDVPPRALLRADSVSVSGSGVDLKNLEEGLGETTAKSADEAMLAPWIRAGFGSPEGFEVWFQLLYAEHPTRGEYGIAKDFIAQEILAGTVSRFEFETGYATHVKSAAWARDGGRYVPKLSIFCRDRGWKFPPKEAPQSAPSGQMARRLIALEEAKRKAAEEEKTRGESH